jgi:arylsulfatase A-like enzyme
MVSRNRHYPSARNVLLSALVLVSAAIPPGCGQSPKAQAPNLVLITIDTLRGDYLGLSGPEGRVSPHLDALMENALVFNRAYATAPFTGPSHASILTSQHPSTHGVVLNGHRSTTAELGDDSVTLAEHLASTGYDTRGIVSIGVLDERFGFGQGFDSFTLVYSHGSTETGGSASKVGDFARDWILTRKQKSEEGPFFMWLHYFDPHLPYVSEPEHRRAVGLDDHTVITAENVLELSKDLVRTAYRAEVHEVDHHIGVFIDFLDKQGLGEDTVIAVVSDHGEYLQEHGLYDHHGLRDEVLHVPMFIHDPRTPAGPRRNDVVSTLDLVPTLLELMGLDDLPGAQGRSLLDPVTADAPRPVHAEWRDFRLLLRRHEAAIGDFQVSVQDGDEKLIRDLLYPKSSLVFDLAADPAEDHDLFATDADSRDRLRAILDRHLKDGLPDGLAGVDDIVIDAESMEMLKSLGYIR